MKSYKPAKGDDFYMVNSRGEVRRANNNGSDKMAKRIAFGNAFRTAREAEVYRTNIRHLQQPSFITRVLTFFVYLLVIMVVIAMILLVLNFVFWLYDINFTLWGKRL